MKRRDFLLKTALMGSAAAVLPVHKLFAVQESPFKEIRRNVGTFVERGGTIGWLSNEDAVVAVDSQFPQSAQNFIDGIKEQTTVGIDLLINTHHHGDHTGGNKTFKSVVNDIVAHKNVPGLQKAAGERRQTEEARKAYFAQQEYANITYDEKWKKDVGDETVHLTYYGVAHTGGDSVVYFEKANVAHMGDLMFNRAYPFIDRPGGANIANWVKVLTTTIKDLPSDTIYIYGHANAEYGVTGSKEDLQLKADFLSALLEYTQKEINAGKSKEEILKAEVIPGFEVFKAPGWPLALNRSLDVAYDELTEG